MCQNTGCNSCTDNCGCTCNACCNNDCNNCCTDPCAEQPCGCDFELSAACVRINREFECIGTTEGQTVEQALEQIDSKLCDISDGEDGEDGDSAYEIWLNLGNEGTEQDFIDSLQGGDGVDGQSIDHVSFTSSTGGGGAGEAGETDTYTVWGDAGETISLGTFVVYNGANGDAEPCDACIDTGWEDLLGFDYYVGVAKPQVRRLGNQIHFRGEIIIPIDDGASGIVPIADADTYRTTFRATPATSPGGITYDSDNRIIFNNDASVIPTGVLGNLINLDGQYENPSPFSTRQIVAEDILGSGVFSTVLLNAYMKMEITPDKKLVITALNTLEQNALDSPLFNFIGASTFRKVTSSFIGRDGVLNQADYNGPKTGENSTIPGAAGIINTALIVGRAYYIKNYQAGDDFTNVGAVSNQAAQFFVATGTTPTVWSNGSELVPANHRDVANAFNRTTDPNQSAQYPIIADTPGLGIDAADPLQVGGFKMKIDGLIAYI